MEKKPAAKKPAPTKTTTTKKPAPAKAAGIVAPRAKPGVKPRVDYDRIEAGWRAGLLSPRQLAAAYTEATGEAVSHAAIIKHFTSRDVPRDLSAKIHAKAEAMVTQAMVTGEVTPNTKVPEKRIVEEGAMMVTEVRLSHRRDIHRARRLTNSLLDELEKQTDPDTLAMLEELGELLRREDDKGVDKKNDLYNKVISLGERSKNMKTLTESLQKLVDMERTAFGMDKEGEKKDDPLSSMLARIASGNSGGLKTVLHDPERNSTLSMHNQVVDDDDDD